ncbi:hypothetical protein [Pseudomonas moraviensis]|uniref:Hydrolase n=1 Tax=Pseudomonas moraviensis TaxID=321662 RepID=A0A7Y9W1H3_9PSED|nr:hypothetical protein [Pseudomonas moraviensis]NYH11938.1 hypothetical protein [Pseudomonas moraviensis]
MNPHFHRASHNEYARPDPRLRVYARFDHVEVGDKSPDVLLAFDLVDARWLDAQGTRDPLFHPDGAVSKKAWDDWKRKRLWRTKNPFEFMPMYRLELEIPAARGFFGEPPLHGFRQTNTLQRAVGELEGKWFVLDIFSQQQSGTDKASLYAGLFADPDTVYVSGRMPSTKKSAALASIFSLDHLPSLTTAELVTELSGLSADLLAVYDVGQGNANALLTAQQLPELYYDLGAGVYRNRRTTPAKLAFCFSQEPTILLSHWDADHWAGAYATMNSNAYPALERRWIAPLQPVGPLHIAFAHDVLKNSAGKFFTYSEKGTIGDVDLGQNRRARFMLGSGPDRNCSGIVLTIEEPNHLPPRSWLLTGDCDYFYFSQALVPEDPVGLVVPHHGADLDPGTQAPHPPPNVTYQRLVYSFGQGNQHGQTNVQHPTSRGMGVHKRALWSHQLWDPLISGTPPSPSSDVRATYDHTPGVVPRGGTLIGWDAPPAIVIAPCRGQAAPCQGQTCNIPLTQT